MADEQGILNTLVTKLPELTGLASSNGPFFFGVFLVIISLIVMFKKENKHMGVFYSVSGIAFMGLATFSFINTESAEKIYPYRITLTNLPKNSEIHLPITDPRMYRDNITTSVTGSSVQVAILSDVKLEPSRQFAVHLLTPITDDNGDDTGFKQNLGKLAVPFNGKALGIYNLQGAEQSDSAFEEDGDFSDPTRYEFIEEGFQDASIGSGFFDTLGAVVVGNAFADDSTVSLSATRESSGDIPPLIIYYRKSADGNAIVNILESTPAKSVVKGSELDDVSNAIWVGKDVPTEIIDAIVSGMLQKNIPIRSISHFDNPDAKTNIIEIGTSKRSRKNDLITEIKVSEFIEQHHALQTEYLKEQQAVAAEVIETDKEINRKLRKQAY